MDETNETTPASTAPVPMTDADVTASNTATAGDATSAPDGAADRAGSGGSAPAGTPVEGAEQAAASVKQTVVDKVGDLRGQAGEKARRFADDGKARATGALDELAKMLADAADQVEDRLGGQFGQYARGAADNVQGFSATLNEKSVEDLIEIARDFVRKSPAAAIGIATALGFVVARLASAGLDQRDRG